jgi:signal transduction histidine kinase
MMILPFQALEKMLGVLVIMTAQAEKFYTSADLTMVEKIATLAALTIDNARCLEETQEANHANEEFLATLSHELRTPVGAIVGYSNLLMSGKLDQAAAGHALQSLHRNAQLQNQLISDLLDISRIVSGKFKLVAQPLDLDKVIEAALDSVRLSAEAKSIQLHYTADTFEGSVIGDPDRLRQIIWNLVSNSIKFTPSGGRIEIRLLSVDSEAHIKVIDNGVGVSPEFLPHVFEKFRQDDNSPVRENTGLGLGLSIVRRLVEMHHGAVQVESEGIGHGATFTVTLPLHTVACSA